MKKTTMIVALAAMMLAGCTNDNQEELNVAVQKEIRFAQPVMYSVSRVAGEISGTKYPASETFMVYGVKYDATKAYPGWGEEGTAYEYPAQGSEMSARYGEESKEPTGWFSEFAHYFKEGYNYAFGAYSPASFNTGVTYDNREGLQVAGFVPEELGSQIDLMYAPRVYDKNMNSELSHKTEGSENNGNEFYDGINLAFRHALSSVHFRVCVDPRYKRAMDAAGYKFVDGDFKIKSITLTNVKNKGDFNENISNEKAAVDKNIYNADPTWTTDGTVKDYKFLDNASYIDVALPTAEQTNIKLAAKDITYMPNGNYGILIPQNIEGSGIKVVIEWQHRKWTDDTNFTLDDMKTEVVLEDYMKDNKMWKQGIRYIYNIVFRENLIYFAPAIEDWTEEENDIFPNPDDSVIVP